MRRIATFAAVLALVACSEGAPGPGRSAQPTTTATAGLTPTTTPTSAPTDDVTMTTRQFSGTTGKQQWSVEVPTLRGLPKEMAAKVNQLLAKEFAPGPSATPQEDDLASDGTLRATVTLYEVNDWFVTLRATTSVMPTGAAHGFSTVEMYVISRANGDRLALKDWFRPGTTADALRVMNEHARTRLPEIFGPDGDDLVAGGTKADEETYAQVAPLPEGLEVTFEEYLVAPYAAGVPVVTIPWTKLAPYLAQPVPAGERDPAYRDGQHRDEDGDIKNAIAKAVKGRFLYERVQQSQYAGGAAFAVATLVPYPTGPAQIVTLKQEGTWKVVPCATVPAPVVRSLMLRCAG